jgi:predicted nucleic acid-binding protein
VPVVDASIVIKWYVQLAHHLGLPLLTADQKLIARLRDPRIKPL